MRISMAIKHKGTKERRHSFVSLCLMPQVAGGIKTRPLRGLFPPVRRPLAALRRRRSGGITVSINVWTDLKNSARIDPCRPVHDVNGNGGLQRDMGFGVRMH